MAKRTAQQIVNFARGLIGIWDRDKLRDGFATDEAQADLDILSYVIEGARELLDTGYSQCYFTLTLDKEDTDSFPYEYGLDTKIHEIIDVRLGSTNEKLEFVSLNSLNLEMPSWRTSERGTVDRYYLTGNMIGIYPKPNLTTETLVILANALVDDLSATTDTLTRLPESFDMIPAWYAAATICLGIGGEEMIIKSQTYSAKFASDKDKLAQWVQARHATDSDRKLVPSDPRIRRPWGYR